MKNISDILMTLCKRNITVNFSKFDKHLKKVTENSLKFPDLNFFFIKNEPELFLQYVLNSLLKNQAQNLVNQVLMKKECEMKRDPDELSKML